MRTKRGNASKLSAWHWVNAWLIFTTAVMASCCENFIQNIMREKMRVGEGGWYLAMMREIRGGFLKEVMVKLNAG